MIKREPKTIGESLLKEGIISRIQLKEALEIKKKDGGILGCILVKKGYINEEKLATHSVKRYDCPYLPLSHYEANQEAIKMVPEEIARKYFILPADKIGNLLTLAHPTPLEPELVEVITKLTGCSLTFYISTISEIEKTIDLYYNKSKKTS